MSDPNPKRLAGLRVASGFLLLSSGLHSLGFVLSGMATSSLFLLGPAALYLLFIIGLWRGMMWVALLALICMIGGAAGTFIELNAAAPMAPPSILWGILIADCAAALVLGLTLWQRPDAKGLESSETHD